MASFTHHPYARTGRPVVRQFVGVMRVLNANFGHSRHGVFTRQPEILTNDFFVNLLDMGTEWQKSSGNAGVYEGRDRTTRKLKWTSTRVDLIFGLNSQLRAIAEVYARADRQEKFCQSLCGGLEQGDES